MPKPFDPYHKWLAIPPDQQPPNHYRLLGVQDLEEDADVIEAAADQRMAHLRTYQSGANANLSQRLLNEISRARVCLLDPAEKQSYDQQLRTTMSSPQAAPIPLALIGQPAVDSVQTAQQPNLAPVQINSNLRQGRNEPKRGAALKGAAIIGVLALAAILIWLFAMGGKPKIDTAQNPPSNPVENSPPAANPIASTQRDPEGPKEQDSVDQGVPLASREPSKKEHLDLTKVEPSETSSGESLDSAPTAPTAAVGPTFAAADCLLLLNFDADTLNKSDAPTRVADLSGRRLHGIVRGAVSTPGRCGECLSFDGQDDFVLVDGLRQILIGNRTALSLCLWVRPKRNARDDPRVQVIFDVGFAASEAVSISMHGQPSVYAFTLPLKHGGVRLTAPAPRDGQWHHLAGVWNRETMQFYLDGELKTERSVKPQLALTERSVSKVPARIGSLAKNDPTRRSKRFFSGDLDEFAVFGRALNPDEVRSIVAAGQGGLSLLPPRQ